MHGVDGCAGQQLAHDGRGCMGAGVYHCSAVDGSAQDSACTPNRRSGIVGMAKEPAVIHRNQTRKMTGGYDVIGAVHHIHPAQPVIHSRMLATGPRSVGDCGRKRESPDGLRWSCPRRQQVVDELHIGAPAERAAHRFDREADTRPVPVQGAGIEPNAQRRHPVAG